MKSALLALAIVAFVSPRGVAGASTCKDYLDNNVYSCHAKSDAGDDFTDCFRFTSPGVASPDFDLAVDTFGGPLACDCQATGSVKTPKFSASKVFECVSPSSIGLGIVFSGKVSSTKIKKGQAVNEFGRSFLYECVVSPTCSAPLASVSSRGGSPYRK
jgi:hypothetical protein